jgi:hypothetical protein
MLPMGNWSGVIPDVKKVGDFVCNLLVMRDLPPPVVYIFTQKPTAAAWAVAPVEGIWVLFDILPST